MCCMPLQLMFSLLVYTYNTVTYSIVESCMQHKKICAIFLLFIGTHALVCLSPDGELPGPSRDDDVGSVAAALGSLVADHVNVLLVWKRK